MREGKPRPLWVQALGFPLVVLRAWLRTVAGGLDPDVVWSEVALAEEAGAQVTWPTVHARRGLRRSALLGNGRQAR